MCMQMELLPELVSPHSVSTLMMKLSRTECNLLTSCSDSEQLRSSAHLLVKAADEIYKVLYVDKEALSILSISSQSTKSSRFITPTIVSNVNVDPSLILYKYNFVKFHHLTRQEAYRCARSFISSVNAALSDLHNAGFAHNDVRLENICFNESMKLC